MCVAPWQIAHFGFASDCENRVDVQRENSILFDMKALSEVAKDAMELSPKQRFALARILLELSDEENDFSPGVESAWEEEIGRRMASVQAGTARSRNFEEVFADLDRRFPS